jgi:hypothetical protein
MADQRAAANQAMVDQEVAEAKPTPDQLRLWMTPDAPCGQHVQLATTTAVDQILTMMSNLTANLTNEALPAVNKTAINAAKDAVRTLNDIAIGQARNALKYERRVAKPITVTTIYTVRADPVEDCSKIKTMKLPTYNGDEDGAITCLFWLNKIVSAAATGNLSHAAALELLIERSESTANSKIRQCKRAGVSFPDTVLKLETAFAKVPPPAEARVQVNSMVPGEREDLAHFAVRLADIAQIAARDQTVPVERAALEQRMCKINYMRILPVHLYNYVVQREAEYAHLGKPELEFEAITSLIEEYQNIQQTKRTRDSAERKKQTSELAEQRPKQYNRVRQLYEEASALEAEAEQYGYEWEANEAAQNESVMKLNEQATVEDLPNGDYTREEVIHYVQQAQRGQFTPRGRGQPPRRPFNNPRGADGIRLAYDVGRPAAHEMMNEREEYKLPGLLVERKFCHAQRLLPLPIEEKRNSEVNGVDLCVSSKLWLPR